jgi:anti-anti-sigma factor
VVAVQIDQLAPDVVCVRLEGEFDLWAAYRFDRELRFIEQGAPATIVLDLREVSFVDSAGLARIVAARRRAERAGRRLAIVRGCRAVERLLALTALDRAIEMVPDPAAVLAG